MRPVHPSVVEAIKLASPLNLFGEPIFRAIWSADVLHHVAGWWNKFDENTGTFLSRVWEVRKVPRYQMAARWIIEKWLPPEFFGTPEQWNEATRIVSEQNKLEFALELGPYPSRGDFMHIWTCQDAKGRYLELTATMAKYAVDIALLPVPSVAELQSAAKTREEEQEKQKLKAVDDMVGDCFPFLGRVNNLSPRSLMSKIQNHKKDGKTV